LFRHGGKHFRGAFERSSLRIDEFGFRNVRQAKSGCGGSEYSAFRNPNSAFDRDNE
jgi:hypothetical protein